MWSSQRNDMDPESSQTVFDAATRIVEIAHETLQRHRIERRFATFPLLLAGTVMTSVEDQQRIRGMLGMFARTSIGNNTRKTVELLETVEAHGRSAVDLISLVKESEYRLVNFGL